MPRPIASDHDEKRGLILKAAAKVFATDGFARASMSRIAAEAGISKANLYHYWGSKDALVFDILDAYLAALRDRICDAALDGTPEERLRQLCEVTLIAYHGSDHEHRIQTSAIPLLPPDRQEVLRDYQRQMVQRMGEVLTDLAPALTADKAVLRDATMSVFGMLNWFYMWNPGAGEEDRRRYAARVAAITTGGAPALAEAVA